MIITLELLVFNLQDPFYHQNHKNLALFFKVKLR